MPLKQGSALLRGWIGDRPHAYVAELLGVAPSHLSHWLNGRRTPNLTYACAIDELTDGAVPPKSWLQD